MTERTREHLSAWGTVLVIFVAAVPAGSILRGEWSPWAWYEIPRHANSWLGYTIGGVWYASFYALGFFIPYGAITFSLFLRRNSAGRFGEVPPIPAHHRRAATRCALGCFVLFMAFLPSIIAFFRAMPTELWNGWFLIMTLILGGLLLWSGIIEFQFRPRGRHSTGTNDR